MIELNWINTTRQFIGLREIKGFRYNPTITVNAIKELNEKVKVLEEKHDIR